jgi:hypothetical protein
MYCFMAHDDLGSIQQSFPLDQWQHHTPRRCIFTKIAKVVDYAFDDINRLTQAPTTADIASGAPTDGRNTIEKWSYDALGYMASALVGNKK